MSIKKLVVKLTLPFLLMAVFSIQTAIAYDSNWKEEQRQLFAQIPVKPGDVIDKSNWQNVKDILPESVVNWVKNGEFIIPVSEFKFDYSPDQEWDTSSAKNDGKYGLGERKEVIDLSTGKYPKYVYGNPFPKIDVNNDPEAGTKIMHNHYAGLTRTASANCSNIALEWVGQKGFEKGIAMTGMRYNFWQRPEGEQPNPGEWIHIQMTPLLSPYDVKGIATITYRPLSGDADTAFTYIPQIRRVKRVSGANRSDPVAGSDACLDDENAWTGDNCSMSWKFITEKTILMPLTDWIVEHPKKFSKKSDGAWESIPGTQEQIVGWQKNGWKGAPWSLVNAVWVPRRMYVLEATPIDPYYTYGKMYFYVDKKAANVPIKIIYDKPGEYWKTVFSFMPCAEWGEKKTYSTVSFTLIVDDKTHHATPIHSEGVHEANPETIMRLTAPEINQNFMQTTSLKLWSK